jgi:hypothetical protein
LPEQQRRARRGNIPWVSDTLIDFGDVEVELCLPPELYERETVGKHFIAGRSRSMVERGLAEIGSRRVARMIDLGIYKGGSAVLYHKLFAPEKLIAVDHTAEPVPSLEDYAARQPDRSLVIARGVDQSDALALDRLCVEHLEGQPLDLVVDDASHLHAPTRASFRSLFPRLGAGACYIIEDWAWAHWPGDYWQKERGGEYFRSKQPVTDLLIELLLLCASSPQIVRRVDVDSIMICVERGDAALQPGFEPSEHYHSRGEAAPQFGPPGRHGRRRLHASPTFVMRQR